MAGGTGDVAAQVLECLPLMGGAADLGMQAEALLVDRTHGGRRLSCREGYKKTWDLFFSWFRDSGVSDVNEVNITAGDDVAFVAALMRCAGTKANGEREELQFRLTIGLRKIGGQWTIAHEHHSIPAT